MANRLLPFEVPSEMLSTKWILSVRAPIEEYLAEVARYNEPMNPRQFSK